IKLSVDVIYGHRSEERMTDNME
ncbi:MAG: hypothetical protein QOH29_1193, partial [Actinomycetota bacterium]|nr:hypothetical protein [Actinomycetota bacterium]